MKKMHPRQLALVRQMWATKNPVQRMGILRSMIEAAQQRGAQPNPAWVQEAQQLALWAQMNLNPAQLHRANLLAEQAKHEWINHVYSQRDAQLNDELTAMTEKAVREMT